MTNTLTIESIEQAALLLQPNARVQLTHIPAQRLSSLPEADFVELWLAETEHRDTEMESGEVTGIPGEEVFRRIRARYNK